MENSNDLYDNTNPPKVKEKTSSDTPSQNDSGESAVQEGDEIVNQEEQTKVVNDDSAEEFLDSVNIPTKTNDQQTRQQYLGSDDEDEEEDDDDDDDDDTEPVIGDDPSETERKIPIM